MEKVTFCPTVAVCDCGCVEMLGAICGMAVTVLLGPDSPLAFAAHTAMAYCVSFVNPGICTGDVTPAIFVPVVVSTVGPVW